MTPEKVVGFVKRRLPDLVHRIQQGMITVHQRVDQTDRKREITRRFAEDLSRLTELLGEGPDKIVSVEALVTRMAQAGPIFEGALGEDFKTRWAEIAAKVNDWITWKYKPAKV